MNALARQAKALAENKRIKRESAEDIDEFFDLCLRGGYYRTMRSNIKNLSPEEYVNYEHYMALLELAEAGEAERKPVLVA